MCIDNEPSFFVYCIGHSGVSLPYYQLDVKNVPPVSYIKECQFLVHLLALESDGYHESDYC